MPQDHARHRFDFDIQHTVALRLCKVAHLCLSELNVGQFTICEGGNKIRNLLIRQFERRRRVVVKLG